MTHNATNTLVDTDPDAMFKEIESAEKERDRCLINYDKLLSNAQATEEWPEAMTFEYLSFMIARIVQENPTVSCTSRAGGSELVTTQVEQMLAQAVQTGQIMPEQAEQLIEEVKGPNENAMACQHALKRWIEQEDYRVVLDRHCDEFLKSFSVGFSWMDKMRGKPENRWPQTCKIEPRRFMMDPLAMHESEAAWKGHWYDIPKPKLEEMAEADEDGEGGWDLQAIKELTPLADDRRNIDRHQVKVYELWVPGEDMGDGDPSFNGALLTMATKKGDSGEVGVEIRKPRKAYVPPWGPYTMYGCYNKSGTAWPMSPLLATFAQQDEIQKHARAMNDNARKYRRVVICSSKNTALITALRGAADHIVISVDDSQFSKDQVVVAEIGGISDQQLKMYGHLRETVKRAMGMDDQQAGKVDSTATATAVAVADEATATRVSYVEGKFIAAVRRDLMTVLWYLVMDERVSFRLGREFAETMGMVEPMFVGGLRQDEQFDFDDLELVIDPYSMGRVSEQALQQRVNTFVETLINMAGAMIQFPFIDWRKVVRSMTQVLNLPELGEAIDFNQVMELAQMQQQMSTAAQANQVSSDQVANEANKIKNQSNAEQLIQNRRKVA